MGDEPVENFRMIERHYFGEKLLKSFDFNFGFCMPNSKNTCEHIYEFPRLTNGEGEYVLSASRLFVAPVQLRLFANSTTPCSQTSMPGKEYIRDYVVGALFVWLKDAVYCTRVIFTVILAVSGPI